MNTDVPEFAQWPASSTATPGLPYLLTAGRYMPAATPAASPPSLVTGGPASSLNCRHPVSASTPRGDVAAMTLSGPGRERGRISGASAGREAGRARAAARERAPAHSRRRARSGPPTGAARAVLPGELFTDREIAWQATVRGHLVAALDAVPGEGGAALKCRIAEALDAVDKADQEGDA